MSGLLSPNPSANRPGAGGGARGGASPGLPPPSGHATPAPRYRAAPLRVACVQFDSKLGRVEENAKRVKELTGFLLPGSVDLVVLPEMALSGYVFSSASSILPYLEHPGTGPTSVLASSLASRLRCHVIAGYPEALSSTLPGIGGSGLGSVQGNQKEKQSKEEDAAAEGQVVKDIEAEGAGVGYNSAIVVGPKGEVVGNYRKSFRFETDKTWAREGDGFKYFDLGAPLGRTAVGICMDMNPKDFIGKSDHTPWDAFELANYCRTNSVDTLVVPMAWLDPPSEPPETDDPLDPEAPSEHNLNYWAARLTPLHDPAPGYAPVGQEASRVGKEVVFVACNRVGTEEGTKFVGTSCVMTISSDPSNIELIECCNMSEERLMLATVT